MNFQEIKEENAVLYKDSYAQITRLTEEAYRSLSQPDYYAIRTAAVSSSPNKQRTLQAFGEFHSLSSLKTNKDGVPKLLAGVLLVGLDMSEVLAIADGSAVVDWKKLRDVALAVKQVLEYYEDYVIEMESYALPDPL